MSHWLNICAPKFKLYFTKSHLLNDFLLSLCMKTLNDYLTVTNHRNKVPAKLKNSEELPVAGKLHLGY